MIKKSKKFLSLMFAVGAFAVIGGGSETIHGQTRDPFSQPGWKKTTTTVSAPVGPSGAPVAKVKPVPAAIVPVGAPPVQERINYFMRLREAAAQGGQPLPKPTLVLTMDELSVTGIFKTPRGYAASVTAVPINLSYTLYPGEKVFDGQLVAIEENKLVFRKVTKLSNGKFVASEQSKTMRQYSDQEVVQGTAPVEQSGRTESANNSAPPVAAPTAPTAEPTAKPVAPSSIVSPLDEMNRQLGETADNVTKAADKATKAAGKTKTAKSASSKADGKKVPAKKPVKVAGNKTL